MKTEEFLMKSRYKAEALTICDEGLSNYLAAKHQKRISTGFIVGGASGVVATTTLALLNQFLNIDLEYQSYLLPLAIGVVVGTSYGVITSEKNDAQYTADFDAVCSSLEEEKEAEGEDDEESED